MDNTPEALLRLRRAADLLAGELERAAEDEKQLYRYLDSEKNESGSPVVVEHIRNKPDFKAAREMATAMKELNTLLCEMYGIGAKQEDDTVRVVLTGATASWAE